MPEERKEHANFGLKKEFVFFATGWMQQNRKKKAFFKPDRERVD